MDNENRVVVRPSRLATLCLVLLTLMALVVFGFFVRDQVYSYQRFHLHGTLSASDWCTNYGLRDAPVYIRDGSNNIIGYARTVVDTSGAGSCTIHFSALVSHVPLYQMTVGTHDGPVYTFDEMQQMGWHLDLHL